MRRTVRTWLLPFGLGLALQLLAPAAGKADPGPGTPTTPTTTTPTGTSSTSTAPPSTTDPTTTATPTTPASTTPTTTSTTTATPTSTTPAGGTPAGTPTTTTSGTTTTTTLTLGVPGRQAAGRAAKPTRSSSRTLCSKPRTNAKAMYGQTLPQCASPKRPNSGHSSTTKAAKPAAKHPAKRGPAPMVTPDLSFAAPLLSFSATTLGMTEFFTEVPPFLLPIYKAAGIEYDVPWQVLAAINEVETDYGRNLSLSSAGAVGWMQFMPATWKLYGVDAIDSGYADPYNPVDAIFAAARYLHAAGASKHLERAIFAYNHATWYVQSVLLRAELIGGMPPQVLNGLTSLVDGRFPVAARATLARAGSTAATIFAPRGARVIAVDDGKVLALGRNRRLGRYLMLQDAAGNVYTYAHLGSLVQRYAVPISTPSVASTVAQQLGLPATRRVSTAPASGGTQTAAATGASRQAHSTSKNRAHATTPATASYVKERLFAYPARPASFASGGAQQLSSAAALAALGQSNASGVLRIGGGRYTVSPLKIGAIVPAGTLLGRVGARAPSATPGLLFKVKPSQAPYVNPEPILNAWHLLDATSIYRARPGNPLLGGDPTRGLVLLMSERQLERRVLADRRLHIDGDGRLAIASGLVDRRILAVLAFLSASGLHPTVSGLSGGNTSPGVTAVGNAGPSVEITKINSIRIRGHQGANSITAAALRLLLTLQGPVKPEQIVSLISYADQTNTLALPDHANRIQITFTPVHRSRKGHGHHARTTLRPRQWTRLFDRLVGIANPEVPTNRSTFSIKDTSDLTIAR